MSLIKNQADCFNLEQTGLSAGQAGERYYNSIRKKAVEQEFSWPGLLISLSIAFFVVIISALALNFVNHSVASGQLYKFLG